MSASPAFEVEIKWDDRSLRQALMARPPRNVRIYQIRHQVYAAAIMALATLALCVAVAGYAGQEAVVAVLVSVGLCWALLGGLQRHVFPVWMHSTLIETGKSDPVTHLFLSAEHLVLHGPRFRSEISWSGILGFCETRDGMVIFLSSMQRVPVPDRALPDGLSRSDLRASILRWCHEAKR